MRWTFLLFVACRTVATPSSQPASSDDSAVVARVGSAVVTTNQLRARIDEQGGARERYKDVKELRALLDNEVRFVLLANEAERRGFDKDPQVREAARRAMVQKMLAAELKDESAVTDDEIEGFYSRNISEFKQPERVQVEILKLDTAEKAAGARERLEKGGPLPALRKELGLESNRDLELKYWSRDELEASYGPEVAKAAFAIQEIGAVAPVVKAKGAYYALQLTGKRPGFHRALSDVKDSIRLRLYRLQRGQSFEALVKDLKERTEVTVDEAALRQVSAAP